MTHNHDEPDETGEYEKNLAEVQSPALVLDVVQQGVREGGHVRHLLMCESKTSGGCKES